MKVSIIVLFLFFSFWLTGKNNWVLRSDSVVIEGYNPGGVANGMIGITSSATPLKVGNIILGGLYDQLPRNEIVTNIVDESISTYVKGFNFLNLELEVDGIPMTNSQISNHRQELRMKEGLFWGSFDHNGGLSVEYSFTALRQLPYSGLMNVKFKAKRDVEILVSDVLETPYNYDNGEFEFNNRILDADFKLLTGSIYLRNGEKLSATTSIIFEGVDHPTVEYEKIHSEKRGLKFKQKIKAGTSFSFAVVGNTISTATIEDPANYSKRINILAGQLGSKLLLDKHIQEWDKLWKSDIIIEGDDRSQLAIRSMLYYLYSSVREDSGMSIPPMGLFGTYYYGHIFWDADLWVLPVFLILKPEFAKNMIEYRYNRLQSAKKNAYAHGYKGAMYPWESAKYGIEDTSPNLSCGPFEVHVTACVAMAAWQYYCVSQDIAWLEQIGFPIIKETANFWVSRVSKRNDGKYEILNVTAPDEHANNVDNDAFTNGAAKKNLEIACLAARVLNLNIQDDWKDISQNLVIEKFPDGITREHKTYNGEKAKQADVSLLAYPLDIVTEEDQIRRDLEFYKRFVIEDGPAMTHSIFSILYSLLGDTENAFAMFERAYMPNYIYPFGMFSEVPGATNRTYFTTGAGGALQSVLMGFAGFRITQKGINKKKTMLPNKWNSMTITSVGYEKKKYVINR